MSLSRSTEAHFKNTTMKVIDRGVSFVRRLSVFYLFAFIFALTFGFYYYKYIPENQDSLNKRAFRILNQLSENIIQKDEDLRETFKSFSPSNIPLKLQINKNSPFGIDSTYNDSAWLLNKTIYYLHDKGWVFSYPCDSFKFSKRATIRMEDFLQNLFQSRDDLFTNFAFLAPSYRANKDSLIKEIPDTSHTKTRIKLTALYIQSNLTTSALLNIDSAFSLHENSDKTTLTDIEVSGNNYKFFARPFFLSGNEYILGGLISKTVYEKDVRSLPAGFISMILIFIMSGFVLLPFAKIFFLSPNENLNRSDVLGATISIYGGTPILLLILFYLFINYTLNVTFSERLKSLSGKLSSDIENDLKSANQQIDKYQAIYNGLSQDERKVLYNKQDDPLINSKLNSTFSPTIYKNIYRVVWINASGQTLAKWNIFNFKTELTSAKKFRAYKLLKQKPDTDSSLVVYPGISNANNEFQVFIMKRFSGSVLTTKDSSAKCMAMGLVGFLNSSWNPVLPAGFGFCVVDNASGDVLFHSDARRNLAENILNETDANDQIQNALQNGTATSIDNIYLYSSPHKIYIAPIKGQPFSLISFYDTNLSSINIFRILHFVAESLLYIFLAMVVCAFLSMAYFSKPSKLEYKINPVEWLRPTARNIRSYLFTVKYFRWMITVSITFFAFIILSNTDRSIIFFISLLVPFYALWGVVASRKKEKKEFREDPFIRKTWIPKFVLDCLPVIFFISLVNWIIIALINNYFSEHALLSIAIIILFQAIGIFLMSILLISCFPEINKRNKKPGIAQKLAASWDSASVKIKNYSNYILGLKTSVDSPDNPSFSKDYIRSLLLSVILISIIPTIGIFLYSLRSESIQYAKADALALSSTVAQKMLTVDEILRPEYKCEVKTAFESSEYFEKLLDQNGIYLAGEQISITDLFVNSSKNSVPDEPYNSLLDHVFPITAGEYNSYATQDRAKDGSWVFHYVPPSQIELQRQIKNDELHPDYSTTKYLQGIGILSGFGSMLFDYSKINKLVPILMILIVLQFLLFGEKFFTMLVHRVFALNLFSSAFVKNIKQNFLAGYFPNDTVPKPEYIGANSGLDSIDKQEEFILQMTTTNATVYQNIWLKLPPEEQYVLYDFALDRFTNYKNSMIISKLVGKGILKYENNQLTFFHPSFRNFILTKKGSPDMEKLKEKFSVGGLWKTIRIPALIIIGVAAIFLILTQENFTHKLAGFITSIGALIPLLMEITKKSAAKT
jgi:hypothetical protein